MAFDDPFRLTGDPSGPAARFFAVTPSDANDIPFLTAGLYVGGAGNVAVLDRSGAGPVVFVGVAAGSILPIRASRVLATATTATNLVGLA